MSNVNVSTFQRFKLLVFVVSFCARAWLIADFYGFRAHLRISSINRLTTAPFNRNSRWQLLLVTLDSVDPPSLIRFL